MPSSVVGQVRAPAPTRTELGRLYFLFSPIVRGAKLVAKLASAASAQSAVVAILSWRTACSGAVDHAENAKPSKKIISIDPKKMRSRQHWVSDSRPPITVTQTA